jgi:chromosomal replication initiation ATPase DnaA
VLGELSLQLNRSTYTNWVHGTKALSYADGVLTVRAKHRMAHDWLTRRIEVLLTPAMTKWAREPVQVRVVLAEEVGA